MYVAPGAQKILDRAAKAYEDNPDGGYIVWQRPNAGKLAAYGGHDTAKGSLGSNVALEQTGQLSKTYKATMLSDFDAAAGRSKAFALGALRPEPEQKPAPEFNAPTPGLG
jgi:hypothetical protein